MDQDSRTTAEDQMTIVTIGFMFFVMGMAQSITNHALTQWTSRRASKKFLKDLPKLRSVGGPHWDNNTEED